ncbi:hypothetical protein BBBOND_0404000 [Babesia bigemina]|uniref:Ribosome-binding protein 1 n=1 Tax=Babesia bigemina TaxID=5866 RepID=A0A061DCN9_BABBI|nr:hypothetical protein BBBOND_0404000 [Babesia bigemina]CDR97912.1 hypothetical protein BBBOND_0404000 [Babesia bigemina]|eukprot:XP_012770098.1 hypothetical protein BBBOND_0404000 [Babesia bigemina]
MSGHGIPLNNLKACFQFLEWFKGDTAMQGKVAVELATRMSPYYSTTTLGSQLPAPFSAFLKNVSTFYNKLVTHASAGDYGSKSAKNVIDAIFECMPKLLAALYFLWYNVDYKFEAVGGGKWRYLYVGWESTRRTWWGTYPASGGALQKYLRSLGSADIDVIPGGFGHDEVTCGYDYPNYGYKFGENMISELEKILKKARGVQNDFRDTFLISVLSGAGTHQVNTANVLRLVRTFCQVVVDDKYELDGGELKNALEKGLKPPKSCINWGELKEHCSKLYNKFNTFFKDDAFSYTGQAPSVTSVNQSNFAIRTAQWFRDNLQTVRSNVKQISIHYPKDRSTWLTHLQPFANKYIFPCGFTFGNTGYGTFGSAWETLPPKWRSVLEMLVSNDGGLAKLKQLLDGEPCSPAPRPPHPPPITSPQASSSHVPSTSVDQGSGGQQKQVYHMVLTGRAGENARGAGPSVAASSHPRQVQSSQQPGPPGVGRPSGPPGPQPSPVAKTPVSEPVSTQTDANANHNNGQSEIKSEIAPDAASSASALDGGAKGDAAPAGPKGEPRAPGPNGPGSRGPTQNADTRASPAKPIDQRTRQVTQGTSLAPSLPSIPEPTAHPGPAGDSDQSSPHSVPQSPQTVLSTNPKSTQPSNVQSPDSSSPGDRGTGSGRKPADKAGSSVAGQTSDKGRQSGGDTDTTTSSAPDPGSNGGAAGVGSGGPKKEPGNPKKDLDAERKKRWNAYGLEQQAKRTIDEEKMKSLIQSVNSNLHTIRQGVQEEALRKAVQENMLRKTRIRQNADPNKVNASTCSNYSSMHIGRSICHTNSTMPMPTTTSSHYLTPDVLEKIKIAEEQERTKQDEQRKRQETNDRHLRALHQGIEIETEILKQHAEQPTYPHADRLISEMNERNTKRDALGTVIPIHPGMEAVKLDGKATPSSKGIPRSTFPPISSNIDVPIGYSMKHKAPQWHDPPPPSKPILQMFRAIPQGIVLNDNHQHRKSASGSRTTVEAPLLSQALEIDPSEIVLNVSGEALKNSTNDDTDLFPAPLTLDATPVPDHMQYKRSVDIYEPAVVKHDVPLTDILPKKRPPPVPAVPKNPFHTRTPFYSELHKPPDSITLFPGDPPSVTQDDMACTPPWMLSQRGVSKPGRADEMPHMPNDSHSRFLHTDVLPRTVREMLYWLAGLRHSAVYDTLEKYISDLVGNYAKQTKSLSSDIETMELAAVPKCIVGNEVTQALRLSCQYSIIVLMGIQGFHDPHTAYKNDNYSKAPQYEYSTDPACLLCQLRDYVYACHHQLQFLKAQCKRGKSHGGWQDCKYGSDITASNSPLQAFLTDGWDSTFETHLFDPCNLCLKSRIRMGFKRGDLPEKSENGITLSNILTPSCGGSDPLLTLSSYLNCITRRTPRTTGELVSYFHHFGNSLHDAFDGRLLQLGTALFTPHADCPDWDHLGLPDLEAVKGIGGHESLFTIQGSKHDHPRTLSTLVGCGSDSSNCPQHCSPITYRAYALYSQSFAHTYLSWTVYLPERLRESLQKLHYDLQKHLGSGKCSSLHSCSTALPLLYTHGFTPPEVGSPPPLQCSDVIAKLQDIVNGNPIATLMTSMDDFLYRVREPFIFTIVALWSLAFLIFANTMLYRLDVLRIRSHLTRSSRSHVIDVKALLTDGTKMPSLYDIDYFDEDVLSQFVVQ